MKTAAFAPFVCASCFAEYAERTYFCTNCFRTGVIIPGSRRPAADLVSVPVLTTAHDLAATDQSVLPLGAYPDLSLAGNSLVTVTGCPGAGKSTLALRIAECLQPSAFIALEEGCGPTLAAKLRRLEIRSRGISIVEPRTVEDILAAARPGLRSLVVDSGTVCSLLPSDWLGLARSREMIVVVTLQQTKAGLHAGSNAWLHDADVCLAVDQMQWRLTKSRFQEAGAFGEVLP